jgi:hypothetical protein
LTLTHNGTSLILPGAENITTAAGDVALMESLGSGNWKCVVYSRQNGQSLFAGPLSDDTVTAASLADSSLGSALINGTITASVGSNALTISIKTKAGADPSTSEPVLVLFRNATAGTGDYTVISITAATSIVISSGSTLGTSSGVASRLWIVGFNDAGTFRLGVINLSTYVKIGDDVIASSTAEGGLGAADSAGVYYTGMAVTSKPMKVLGYIESTQSTAGSWATAPSKIQLTNNIYQTLPPVYGFQSGYYESPPQTITAGGSLTIPHGLGRKPILFQYMLVCTTAELGYSIGDELPIEAQPIGSSSSSIAQGVAVVPDDTNLNVRFGSQANVFQIIRKDTGSNASITIANWRFVVRCWG